MPKPRLETILAVLDDRLRERLALQPDRLPARRWQRTLACRGGRRSDARNDEAGHFRRQRRAIVEQVPDDSRLRRLAFRHQASDQPKAVERSWMAVVFRRRSGERRLDLLLD